MSGLLDIELCIQPLLAGEPYKFDPVQHDSTLLALFKEELSYACESSPAFRNYIEHWPIDYRASRRVADLPFLPVGAFKISPPLALVDRGDIIRTLASSSTTGQTPSRVVLDAPTAKRMTKGVMTIIRDFIGPARRPYLVIDTPATLAGSSELGARGAAIQGLRSFATEVVCCLKSDSAGDLKLDAEKLLECAAKWKGADVLVYGFTYILWNYLVKPLRSKGITLNLPNARILHSGGWKRLQEQAVTKEALAQGVAAAFDCSADHVIDFYGMVENVGVVYPDCAHGNKHVPTFADMIVRDPLTLEPLGVGQRGLAQVCSVLPTSFPGFLALTEDIAEVVRLDGCPCGRRGRAFRFVSRAPKAEARGCGNVETVRGRPGMPGASHE